MTVLLDTSTVIWAGQFEERLSANAKRVLLNVSNEVLVSAATAWEMATKVRIGKLNEAKALESRFLEWMADANFTLLPITVSEALRAGRFVGEHRDPWDRMIAAQALVRDIPVVSSDSKLDGFGVRRIW